MRGLLEYNMQGLGLALHTFRELLSSDEAYQIFAVLKKLSIRQNYILSNKRKGKSRPIGQDETKERKEDDEY